VSYRLADNFESLRLMGAGDLDGKGNDIANDLIGNAGNNRLFGRGGDDVLFASAGNDSSNGGAGSDTIEFTVGEWAGVTVNLATGKGGGAAAGQSFVNIENVIGNAGKDHIIGNAAANHLSGYTGNDVLTGGGGKDLFEFIDADGADTITDFKDKTDRIDLNYHVNGVDIDHFSQLAPLMHQEGKNVVFDFGNIFAGDELVIKNAHVGDFSGADFLFQ
jgi:Ca2+-binding RTX toxin-like protein